MCMLVGCGDCQNHWSKNKASSSAVPLNLVQKYARTEIRRNSFSVRVAEPWNKLSRETRESRNVQQFKRRLKNELK